MEVAGLEPPALVRRMLLGGAVSQVNSSLALPLLID